MKTYKLTYLLLAAFLLTVACSKTEAGRGPVDGRLIGFNTVNSTSTKAASAYPTTQPFITQAYKLVSGKTWDANKAEAGSPFIDEKEVTYDATYNYWKTADNYYWPSDGSTLTFFSYSPASLKGKVSVSIEGVSIPSWDVKTDAGDILVADIAKDKSKNEGYAGYTGVPTLFRQKLARIAFRFGVASDAAEGTQVKLTGISLRDVYSSGTYAKGGYGDDDWTPSSINSSSWALVSSEMVLSKGSLVEGSSLEFNMIPQRLVSSISPAAHPILEISYSLRTNGGSTWEPKTASCYFDENLRQESWEKGKKYTYTIYIGVGQYPIDFDANVSEWGTIGDGSVDIG